MDTLEKPLFIPLKREYFEAFERGEKGTEYRKAGPRWNSRTCRIGRRVTLCLGYSGRRLHGVITDFYVATEPEEKAELPAWRAIYGDSEDAACIEIALDGRLEPSG